MREIFIRDYQMQLVILQFGKAARDIDAMDYLFKCMATQHPAGGMANW
jgi:hypothetical protein